MNKLRCDSYEAQLTQREREKLFEKLLRPGVNIRRLIRTLPPWRTGPKKGEPPSYRRLLEISARLRAEQLASKIEANSTIIEKIQDKLLKTARFTSRDNLKAFCSLLSQELIANDLDNFPSSARLKAAQILQKNEDQNLACAKFKRDTCKLFIEWYEDERARRILAGREAAAEKLEMLGKLIYGEEW
jgi:hypothetical protein